jgi:rare lipoprotein A
MRRGEKDMRYLFASLVLSLLLCASASLPAAAQSSGSVRERWSEGIFRDTEPSGHTQRQRLARASTSESYDDDEARPRRRTYHRADGASRSRYTKRRQARVAKHMRRHQRTARKPGIGRSKTVQQRQKPAQRTASAPTATPPATTPPTFRKSLGSDGQKRPGALGVASFYWQPQALASGGRFNPDAMTAAHKTLPFGTRVRVTHLGNGRSVEVKINDRGPYIAGRIIDLSRAAAGIIGMTGQGIARVAVEVLGK